MTIQRGCARVVPQNARHFDHVDIDLANDYIQQARIVVAHAGIGTIISARRYGKPLVIVPRRKCYGEHTDDHQSEIAGAMEQEGVVRVVYEVQDLERAIRSVKQDDILTFPPGKDRD